MSSETNPPAGESDEDADEVRGFTELVLTANVKDNVMAAVIATKTNILFFIALKIDSLRDFLVAFVRGVVGSAIIKFSGWCYFFFSARRKRQCAHS